MNKGKFIVIEGTDGSGKTTQIKLLSGYLKKVKIPHQIMDFPRYEDNVYGKLVGRYLKGEFGGIHEVSPYLAALTFAGDRALAKPLMDKALKNGKLLIANRYVLSNKAHMSTYLPESQREAFIKWLDALEYGANDLPKEDLVIFLYLDPEVAQKNIGLKGKRLYLGEIKRDIHENNLDHLKESARMYLELSKDKNWEVINCMGKNGLRSIEEIHQEILKVLRKKNMINA